MTAYYVRNSGSTGANGSDSNDGLTTSTPFLTFAKGLSVLAAGDTLYLDGTFYEMKLVLSVAATITVWPGATWQPQVVGGQKITVAWTGPTANIYTAVQDLGAGFTGVSVSGGGSGQSIGLTADYGIIDGVTTRMLTDSRGKSRPYGHLKQVATATNAGEFHVAMAGTVATITARLYADADPNTKTMVVMVSNTVAGSGTGLGIGLYIKADGAVVDGIWFNRFMCWDTGQGYAIQGGYGTSNGGCRNVTISNCRFSDTGWHAVGWPDLICQGNTVTGCVFDHTCGDNGSGDYGIPTVFRSGNTSGTVGPEYITTGRCIGNWYNCSQPIMESGIAYLPMPRGGTALAGAHINHTAANDSPVGDVQVSNCTAAYDVANDIGAGSPAGSRGSPWRSLNGSTPSNIEDFTTYGARYSQCTAINVDRTETGDNVAFQRCSFLYSVVNASIQSMIVCNATFGSQIATAGYDAAGLFDTCEFVCVAGGAGPSLSRFASYSITGANSTRVQRWVFLNTAMIQNYTSRMVGFQSQGVGTLYVTARYTIFAWPSCTATNCLFLFDDATANKIINPVFQGAWYPLDARFGASGWSSNTSRDTKAEWIATVDPTGIYNTAPAFVSATTNATPTAGGNITSTPSNPTPARAFFGLNGNPSNGIDGPYQYGISGFASRGRGRDFRRRSTP